MTWEVVLEVGGVEVGRSGRQGLGVLVREGERGRWGWGGKLVVVVDGGVGRVEEGVEKGSSRLQGRIRLLRAHCP